VLAGLTRVSEASAQAMAQMAPSRAVPTGGIEGTETMTGMGMQGMTMSDQRGQQMPISVDMDDVDYDAFLANDRTLADPEIVHVERSGRIRLRIINGASSSQFWIDLGELVGRVVAADGHPVKPVEGRRFPLAIAQRLDILIDLPATGMFPILARLEGEGRQTGIIVVTPGAPIPRIPDSAQAAPPVDNSLEIRLDTPPEAPAEEPKPEAKKVRQAAKTVARKVGAEEEGR
jgi:FtsP/CotA-like multicopper oxidase with cupredoxin domain